MRCRRCGSEVEEGFERCPSCSYLLSGASGELPPMPKWEEEESSKTVSAKVAVQTIGSATRTGPLKTGSLKKAEPVWRVLLSQEVTPRMLIICTGVVVSFIALILLGLYISNLPALHGSPRVDIEKSPNLKALKMVEEYPSTTKGFSVQQRAEQFAKEEQATGYNWWSAPEKNSGQYAVVFVYEKGGKQRFAFWLVDLEKRTLRAKNPLAQSFSGL